MTTLFDIMVKMAVKLPEAWQSTATGGSTTYLDDSTLVENDDYFNGGVILFQSGNRISTSAVVTDFTGSSGRITFATGLACASTDKFVVMPEKRSRNLLVTAINSALLKQNIKAENESLTGSSSTIVHTLPAGVSRVIQVYYGSDTDGWTRHHYWHERNGELEFYKSPPNDAIRLVYLTNHGNVVLDTDTIDSQINVELLVLDALYELHRKRSLFGLEAEKFETDQMQKYDLDRARKANQLPGPIEDPVYSPW